MAGKAELVKKLRDMRPVDSLILLPDNPRHGDIGAISQSLERFGQQKPIVVNSDGVILAGNHTFQAAKALGWEEIWVAESELEGADQPGFALADNRLSDLATYDHDALLRYLKEQPDLIGTGYDAEDLEDLYRFTQTLDWDGLGGDVTGASPTATRTFHIPKDRVDLVDAAIDATSRRLDCSAGEALVALLTDVG